MFTLKWKNQDEDFILDELESFDNIEDLFRKINQKEKVVSFEYFKKLEEIKNIQLEQKEKLIYESPDAGVKGISQAYCKMKEIQLIDEEISVIPLPIDTCPLCNSNKIEKKDSLYVEIYKGHRIEIKYQEFFCSKCDREIVYKDEVSLRNKIIMARIYIDQFNISHNFINNKEV